ncbi:MAG: hypothetical protein AAGJ35_03890 [Myxococcota bacterium]
MASKKRKAPATQEASRQNNRTSQVIFLMLFGGLFLLGLFWLFEQLNATQNKPFLKAIIRISGSLVTVFATYFLVNRALRQRERQSDAVVAAFAGYIDYSVQLYKGLYEYGPEDDQEVQDLLRQTERFEDYEEFKAYARNSGIDTQNIHQFLMNALYWPSYLETARERMLDIHDATRQLTLMLGVSTPKLAPSTIQIIDEYSVLFKDELPVLRRGLRAFHKLEAIAQHLHHVPDPRYKEYLYEDVVDCLAAIYEAIIYTFVRLPRLLEETMRHPLQEFRKQLHKRYHDVYDQELIAIKDDLESLDID